ncbi:hypothetical protein scyTo_0014616 [Scyliorhinus torazame]|uniref:Choline transporter-like protein n=1 Tax=Scyliorhinus torazame TaxID=75743 RepID=A0A401NRB4_SCYTO|nr:hypothetical protein [Scyliorhinus torazame]
MSCCGQYEVSGESVTHREWRPQIYRRCTDVLWLVIFCLFWGGMMFIAGYAVTVGSAERLIFGYDSFGNICGKKNSPVKGASLSGQDMSSRNLNISDYTEPSKAAHLCPKLPIPPSQSFPLFNRCVPRSPACYSHFLTVLINVVKESDFFQRIIGGIMANKEYIIGLSFFAVVLSFIMVAVFRFIATLLVHIFIALVIFGLLFVSGVLWWLYYDNMNDPNIVLETEKENTKALLGFAITATIISLDIFIQIVLILSSSLHVSLEGNAYVTADNLVEYRPLSGIRYMWWYHVIGLIWTSEFLVACQQMTIAGAVVCCYFNRDKNNPPSYPILSSVSKLFNYHLGTVVKGSFIITFVRIPRIVLLYVHSILKGKESTCARCLAKCCACCLCCLEKWLRFLNQNAYVATAINGTNFCTSAKEAFFLIVNNALNVTAINCFGDFLLFLGKVFVVCFTIFGGLVAFNYNRDLNVWVIPLIMVSFFAYLMAHCFLSVFEMVVDVLFMCYAVDLATNDGSAEKPYFMDKELMKFVGKSNQELKRISGSDKSNLDNNRNTELLPMQGTNTA